MISNGFLNDDFLESLPNGTTPIMQTKIEVPEFSQSGTGSVSGQTFLNGNNGMTEVFSDNDRGVATTISTNPGMANGFPSLSPGNDDNGLAAGASYMRNLVKAQQAYAMNLATKDPQAAGMAFADIEGMKDGFNSLVNEGWNGKEAAHILGVVGRVFGGYGNAVENAKQLKRFAYTRGIGIQNAGNELWSLQKNFGAGYLTDYGFTDRVTPDSAHYENIRNNFTDILSAMWKVEDAYNWQFDQATYRDVFNRCRKIAADLDLAGLSVKSVGAEAIVRSALSENGSLRDDRQLNRAVSDLMAFQAKDKNLVTLVSGLSVDTASNPFSLPTQATTQSERQAEAEDLRDFGLVRSLRQELFRHRARAVNSGLAANDFSDYQTLRDGFIRAFRSFSTRSSAVSDKTFSMVADAMVSAISEGKPVSVAEAASSVASTLVEGQTETLDDWAKGLLVPTAEGRRILRNAEQAEALGTWSRSLLMDTAEGERRLREIVYPFIEEVAMATGLSFKDPAMEPFVAQAYNLVKQSFLDRKAVVNLDDLGAEITDDDLWDEIRQKLAPQIIKLSKISEAKNMQIAAQAKARKVDDEL